MVVDGVLSIFVVFTCIPPLIRSYAWVDSGCFDRSLSQSVVSQFLCMSFFFAFHRVVRLHVMRWCLLVLSVWQEFVQRVRGLISCPLMLRRFVCCQF